MFFLILNSSVSTLCFSNVFLRNNAFNLSSSKKLPVQQVSIFVFFYESMAVNFQNQLLTERFGPNNMDNLILFRGSYRLFYRQCRLILFHGSYRLFYRQCHLILFRGSYRLFYRQCHLILFHGSYRLFYRQCHLILFRGSYRLFYRQCHLILFRGSYRLFYRQCHLILFHGSYRLFYRQCHLILFRGSYRLFYRQCHLILFRGSYRLFYRQCHLILFHGSYRLFYRRCHLILFRRSYRLFYRQCHLILFRRSYRLFYRRCRLILFLVCFALCITLSTWCTLTLPDITSTSLLLLSESDDTGLLFLFFCVVVKESLSTFRTSSWLKGLVQTIWTINGNCGGCQCKHHHAVLNTACEKSWNNASNESTIYLVLRSHSNWK